MNTQIVLRNVTSTAAHFVNLLVRLSFCCRMRDASKPRSNAAAVRLRSDGANLDPVIIQPGITTQELRIVVHRIDYDVDVPVIVEVAESTTAARCGVGNSRSS